MEKELKSTWDEYYDQSSSDTILKDRNFFEMEIRALEGALAEAVAGSSGEIRILELGSGTGALADALLAAIPADRRGDATYVGVDFSEKAVARAVAKAPAGARFVASDFLAFMRGETGKFDVIVSQRSVMALIDRAEQEELLSQIRDHLAPGGVAIMSEGTQQGADTLNRLRTRIGIAELDKIWHCMYLDEEMVQRVFPVARIEDYASQYWLITRVIYPFSSSPQHNTPLHDLAAALPQEGDHGLVKLIVASSPRA